MQMKIVIIININMVNGDVIMINDHKHDNNFDNMKIIKITIKEITTTIILNDHDHDLLIL